MLVSRVTAAQPPSFTVSPCRGMSRASLPPQHFLTFEAASHTDGLVLARHRNGACRAGEKGEQLPSALTPAPRCHHRGKSSRGVSLPASPSTAAAFGLGARRRIIAETAPRGPESRWAGPQSAAALVAEPCPKPAGVNHARLPAALPGTQTAPRGLRRAPLALGGGTRGSPGAVAAGSVHRSPRRPALRLPFRGLGGGPEGQRLPVVRSPNHTHSTRKVKRKSLLQHQQRLALEVMIISHQHYTPLEAERTVSGVESG